MKLLYLVPAAHDPGLLTNVLFQNPRGAQQQKYSNNTLKYLVTHTIGMLTMSKINIQNDFDEVVVGFEPLST